MLHVQVEIRVKWWAWPVVLLAGLFGFAVPSACISVRTIKQWETPDELR